MKRSFDLTFTTPRGDFRMAISLEKSFTDRASFKTGYNGQPVKYIKVTSKDPSVEKITSRKEIEYVVQVDELESLWPTGDEDEDGNPTYVVVDKSSLKNAFPSSSEMRVLETVPLVSIPLHTLEGSHYLLSVTKTGKNRIANPDDEAMYDIVWHGLRQNSEALVVTYSNMNNNKYAILTAAKDGLRLSNLIGSNHQKKFKEQPKLDEETKQNLNRFERLVESSRADKPSKYKDDYSDKLDELVQAALTGKEIKPVTKPKQTIFSRLDALDDDDEVPKKRQKSRAESNPTKKKQKIKN